MTLPNESETKICRSTFCYVLVFSDTYANVLESSSRKFDVFVIVSEGQIVFALSCFV